MASLNKQQKRAKRAKAKAKQIRMVGRKPLEQDEDLDHLAEPIPEYTLAMFSKMRDAEAISRNEMLLTLLRELAFIIVDHPDLLDMENAENEGMAATHLAADMLIDYRMWAEGVTIEEAQAWLSEPQFITDFGIALDTYSKSVDDSEAKAE
ncbi:MULTISPECIES: hypothetical protein [Pseudomonas]|jgi:hypothetical protein|uniref:Uncharacterized protein n=1 Tax=Pseudomonas fluorescens TaxID=294 RepID=A0A5E7KC05_PSEFL|nr:MULTISPECIES: hypothetical protein [Pseudomonas]KPG99229.1 hypothetical protein AK821_06545 [Pseudomonas sp. RIT-PI-r]MCP1484936.1 hypothetical protein [Pseudomonas fluorescens]PRB52579.1 hypothetical protein CQ025_07485 [Pseudomonas sp. MYb3]PRC35091.1 hypothetical protein CQ009_10840 [Pseudomonas sp. MYb2]VVO99491.1 hypothetical protein PS896_02748 [Pseudomonas fluorescens]